MFLSSFLTIYFELVWREIRDVSAWAGKWKFRVGNISFGYTSTYLTWPATWKQQCWEQEVTYTLTCPRNLSPLNMADTMDACVNQAPYLGFSFLRGFDSQWDRETVLLLALSLSNQKLKVFSGSSRYFQMVLCAILRTYYKQFIEL